MVEQEMTHCSAIRGSPTGWAVDGKTISYKALSFLSVLYEASESGVEAGSKVIAPNLLVRPMRRRSPVAMSYEVQNWWRRCYGQDVVRTAYRDQGPSDAGRWTQFPVNESRRRPPMSTGPCWRW